MYLLLLYCATERQIPVLEVDESRKDVDPVLLGLGVVLHGNEVDAVLAALAVDPLQLLQQQQV